MVAALGEVDIEEALKAPIFTGGPIPATTTPTPIEEEEEEEAQEEEEEEEDLQGLGALFG
jgi:large subunit ribosomal protein L12